jgi:hypothetical protein
VRIDESDGELPRGEDAECGALGVHHVPAIGLETLN